MNGDFNVMANEWQSAVTMLQAENAQLKEKLVEVAMERDQLKVDLEELRREKHTLYRNIEEINTAFHKDITALKTELAIAERSLISKGYRKECNISACNCGGQWTHGGKAEERLQEISDAVPYANGVTILGRVEQLKADLAQANQKCLDWQKEFKGAVEGYDDIEKELQQAQAREQRVREEFKVLKVTNEQLGWALRELGPTGNNAEAYIKAAVERFMVMRKHALEEAGT